MADEPKTQPDAFGVERNAETGVPVEVIPEAEAKPELGEDGKPKVEPKGKEGKEGEVPDIEKHPVVVGLKEQIEKVKSELGGNLSGQREVIEGLQKKLAKYEKGEGAGEGAFVFDPKEIKRTKDLKPEELEGMTDTEKKQMDEIADMKERVNGMFTASTKEKEEEKNKGDEAAKVQDRVVHVGKTAQAAAKKLAGDDVEMANTIIEAFNSLKFDTTGLSDEDIAKRVETAAKTITAYKGPKEQATGGKGKVVADAGGGDDPFGNNAIVAEAAKKGRDSYSL